MNTSIAAVEQIRRAARSACAFALVGVTLYFFRIPISVGWSVIMMCAGLIVEFPPVSVGRSIGLPIETGGAAFIFYNLSPFGYLWVFSFWIFAVLLVVWLIAKSISMELN